MATIAEQIATIDAQIATKNGQIAELRESAAAWRDSKKQCAGTSKKKAECAAGKETTAQNREAAIPGIQREIDQLIASKNSLLEEQKAANTANIKLADKGISQAAAITLATGQAKAVQDASMVTAQAEAEAIGKTAESSNMQRNMMIGFAGLVVLVLIGFAVKKLASKSKSKKK